MPNNMRKFIYTISIAIAVGSIESNTALASEVCHQVKGTVIANDISQTEVLGVTEMKVRDTKIEGAILGKITSFDATTIPIVSTLDQTLAFPKIGVIYTRNNSAVFVPLSGSHCIFSVDEQLNVVAGTGLFAGARGNVTAVGTVDFCTGEHKIRYTGSYCVDQ